MYRAAIPMRRNVLADDSAGGQTPESTTGVKNTNVFGAVFGQILNGV